MLAIIQHPFDTDLGLQLVQYGTQYMWIDLLTGHQHGAIYQSKQKAIRGLQRLYNHPFNITFKSTAIAA